MHTDRPGDARRPGAPGLRVFPAATSRPHTVVLVLHGGKARSQAPVRATQLAYQRMIPIARIAHRAIAAGGAAVWLLRNRIRGWNGPAMDAVQDARWALSEIDRAHPWARVVLVGHSMGGRAALRLAGEPRVKAVCALAPWIESNEPNAQLEGRSVLLVHGDGDRITSARACAEYADRAHRAGHSVRHVEIAGAGHAMLRRRAEWDDHVRRFVLATASTDAEGSTDPRPRSAEVDQ